MRTLLRDESFIDDRPTLPPDIQAIVDAGWTVGPNGALLLASLWWEGRHDIPSAQTGHAEYEVNDVHISLGDLRRENPGFLSRAASRGLFFAMTMLEKALVLPHGESLLATVAVPVDVDDPDFSLQGTTVRFFSRRGNYPGWFDDLEGFRLEAIAVLDGSDVPQR